MTPIVSSWFSPALGTIKFNFDTLFTSSTKEAFSGVVARNSTGLIMAACLLHHFDVIDFFIAEARACEDAVNFAIELDFRFIHVEGDSLKVINKILSSSIDHSLIRPIIFYIKTKLGIFEKSLSLTSVDKGMRQLMYSPRPIAVSNFPYTGLKEHRWKSNEWPFVISESRFKL
ncbi:hypothetical protein V6N11_021091 [Hibiscus sabdariffa]|uniref:RNase H type-1 domain-containing protein n=1 Tax=Hibiscus sabdariffa TaxID=183260 RepID=A0ABR2A5E2_9ROSI